MTETTDPAAQPDEITGLRRENADLQQAVADLKQEMASRLVHAEIKAEAMRAGIIDVDALRLLDMTKVEAEDRNGGRAREVVERLRADKPYLFHAPSSSQSVPPPEARPPVRKLATEMTDEEYRVARANLLRRHNT